MILMKNKEKLLTWALASVETFVFELLVHAFLYLSIVALMLQIQHYSSQQRKKFIWKFSNLQLIQERFIGRAVHDRASSCSQAQPQLAS